jgi:hypothetical protein
MRFDRRTFIVGTGLVSITATFDRWSPQAATHGVDSGHVEFKIAGWSVDDGREAPDAVWITLSRSWRASWR